MKNLVTLHLTPEEAEAHGFTFVEYAVDGSYELEDTFGTLKPTSPTSPTTGGWLTPQESAKLALSFSKLTKG